MRVGKADGVERGEMGGGSGGRLMFFFSLLGCVYVCLRGLFSFALNTCGRKAGIGEEGLVEEEEARAEKMRKREKRNSTVHQIPNPSQPHPSLSFPRG